MPSRVGHPDTSGGREEKTTNEKPVSLHPLEFEEALAALLATSPPPKECKPKGERKSTTQRDTKESQHG